jgi:hypothetical protein
MKTLFAAAFSLFSLMSFAFLTRSALADDVPPECAQNYSVTCRCDTLGYVDAYVIYVVEKCLDKENWVLLDRTQYSQSDCEAAILTNEVCQSLPK